MDDSILLSIADALFEIAKALKASSRPFVCLGDTEKGINAAHILSWEDGMGRMRIYPESGESYEVSVPMLSVEFATAEGEKDGFGPAHRTYTGAQRLALLAWLTSQSVQLALPPEPALSVPEHTEQGQLPF